MQFCPCERNPAISRSRSWPMLCTVPEEEPTCGGSGTVMAAADEPRSPDSGDACRLQQPQQQQQQQQAACVPAANVGRLLRRHYYPEAGWGWVVVACACMVHLLNHGTQLSFGALEQDVVHRFRDADYSGTGQSYRVLASHCGVWNPEGREGGETSKLRRPNRSPPLDTKTN